MNKVFIASTLGVIAILAGCSTDADTASKNLSVAAEQFEVDRRVVFFNGITDKYLLTIEGRCSIESGNTTGVSGALEVTCKTGENEYKKHFLGLSDNVSYFVEQLKESSVDVYHYRVIFKPQIIVPDIDLEIG